MNIIKIILGIEAVVIGFLAILWLLGNLAILGIEIDYMSEEYLYDKEMMEYHEQLHKDQKEG